MESLKLYRVEVYGTDTRPPESKLCRAATPIRAAEIAQAMFHADRVASRYQLTRFGVTEIIDAAKEGVLSAHHREICVELGKPPPDRAQFTLTSAFEMAYDARDGQFPRSARWMGRGFGFGLPDADVATAGGVWYRSLPREEFRTAHAKYLHLCAQEHETCAIRAEADARFYESRC